MIELEWPKATLKKVEFYKAITIKINSKIMSLPAAWIKRAFSTIGGKADERYENTSKEISEGIQTCIESYVNAQTQQLQGKVSELEQKNLELNKSLDGITRMIPKETILSILPDDDLKYELLGRAQAEGYEQRTQKI
tara:strand:+ start:131 stop:541 length:411 start_codon:yes stop_codon:yes gene_type:complete